MITPQEEKTKRRIKRFFDKKSYAEKKELGIVVVNRKDKDGRFHYRYILKDAMALDMLLIVIFDNSAVVDGLDFCDALRRIRVSEEDIEMYIAENIL